MANPYPRILKEANYYQAAQEYLASLPLEHFMEATPQATQRKITLESLDLVHDLRPDIQIFNELLVQYPLPKPKGKKKIGQVVPDNMVVVHSEPIQAEGSYDVPLQPVGPFWMLEYVSRSSRRKDYEENMRKYEHELKAPYYLLFTPEEQELVLFRHNGEKYITVLPNEQNRFALPEIELEVAILETWVRFWFRGELLLLPADLSHQANTFKHQRDEERQGRLTAESQRDEERKARLAAEAELAQLRAQMNKLKGDSKS